MRAKLSTTADGIYRGFAPPARSASDFFSRDTGGGEPSHPAPHTSGRSSGYGLQRSPRPTHAVPPDIRGEGLLHDARNLVSAIGLYCDLLSMPGVLKPEHRQYPEELRLLGTRSRVLIEHLLRSLVCENLSNQSLADQDRDSSADTGPAGQPDQQPTERIAENTAPESYDLTDRRMPAPQPASRTSDSGARPRPVSLRTTVERCSGLLSRVASGRPIEVIYGPAADLPVSISEEAIERILVNLVRNASQALDHKESLASPDDTDAGTGPRSTGLPHRPHRRPAASVLPGSRMPIRISVGPLLERIGEARSWPFQHVRLVVEDCGCGMSSAQLHSLLSPRLGPSRGTHGIGFRVVRELVAASNGDLRAASTPGTGTQVQIEWPVAASTQVAASPDTEKHGALMQRKREPGTSLKSHTPERPHRSIPLPSQPSAIAEGSQGAY